MEPIQAYHTSDRIISPAEIGEYLSFSHCSRYFKHRSQEIERSTNHSGSEFKEAFHPLNLLLSKAGEDFETGIVENLRKQVLGIHDLTRDDDRLHPDHGVTMTHVSEAISSPPSEKPVILYQPTYLGTIGAWGVGGHADFVFIWSTDSGALVRVVDAKSASEQQAYHQIQASIYTDLIQQHVELDSVDIDREQVTFSAGVITRDETYAPPTADVIPSFDVDSRIVDTRRLLSEDGEMVRVADTDFEDVYYQLDDKCSGCAYNESCMTESFEAGSIRLLGLTESEQKLLAEYDIETLEDLASICRYPKEWSPTNYQKAAGQYQKYKEIKSLPGIGERLPTLVYEAQALLDRFVDDDAKKVDAGPVPWIPATGRCDLPEDSPPENRDVEFMRGSTIRVYLNVQEDYLRDRIVQMSARVTATASDSDPIRISRLTTGASSNANTSKREEYELFSEFIEELYDAIREINEGIDYSGHHQQNPLIHFYLYTQGETDALVDAFDRHEAPLIDSFHDLIEGKPGVDTPRVSHLRSEIVSHISLESPAAGLVQAYDEIQPASDAYSKSRSEESWSYEPSYLPTGETVSLRSVFRRRLFNISVDWEVDDGSAIIDPKTEDDVDGLNTRVRYGAGIPLGYIWSAVGKINSDWIAEAGFDVDSNLSGYELGNYQYHDASVREQRIVPEDVTALGRNLCDVLEHLERGLYFRDTDIASRKDPLDIGDLETDSYEQLAVGAAAKSYIEMEYTISQAEKYETYRKMPVQRILSGDSIPVQITEIDTETGNDLSVSVTGRLRYDHMFLFGDDGDLVKRNCRRKGSEGTSSGDWMVANPYKIGNTKQTIADPSQLESGVNATIKWLDLQNNEVGFELTQQWWDPGEYGSFHRNWTTERSQAENSNQWTYIGINEWLILDPQTDSISADREMKALETIQLNALHDLIESIRWGDADSYSDETFDQRDLEDFASWVSESVEPESLPNDNQREFIVEDSQMCLLQGPPGTGKTAGTVSPSICSRVYAAEQRGESLNGLITAPSNTAIDEMMDDVAELVEDIQTDPDAPDGFDNINLVRLSNDEPEDISDCVEYADYNDEKGKNRLDELLSEMLCGSGVRTDGGHAQTTFGSFGGANSNVETETDIDATTKSDGDDGSDDLEHTLFFATPTKSWGLLKHYASGKDDEAIARQRYWDLLVVDEASMMTVPKLLLAGVGMKSTAQILVSGDHRQLPPVQKHDWSDEKRRDIRDNLPYLSGLDYLRVLAGDDDVVDKEVLDRFSHAIDPERIDIPMVKLDETYRFGPNTAEFVRQTVYEADGIDYTSGRSESDIRTSHTASRSPLEAVFDHTAPIVLITYDSEKQYQQVNPIEAAISQTLLMNHGSGLSAGLVTPHNAQRSRLQDMLYGLQHSDSYPDVDIRVGDNTFVETVERFQGGEQDLMIVSATVSDPRYIDAENEFLLQQNRANVSFTRHQNKLVVVAPETLFAHIPDNPEIYNEAELWKSLAVVAGEAPTKHQVDPDWTGTLADFVEKGTLASHLDGIEPTLNVYQIESGDVEK